MKCVKYPIIPEFSTEEISEAICLDKLLTMEIEFNRECNFNCIHCYVPPNSQTKDELTKKELQDVIIQAKNLGARTIVVLGGEPMLYPHIQEMIKFIRNQDLEVELFTNGTNVSEFQARMLFDYDVIVVLKMNTFDEKLQDMLSGKKGAYKQVQDALKNLKLAGYPARKQLLGISTVICRQNLHEIVDLWKWLRDQNIIPYFEMITPQGKVKSNNQLNVDSHHLRELFYELADIDREIYGYDWEPQPPLAGIKCMRHLYSCVVTVHGNVQPCVGVPITVGNVRKNKLSEIIRDSDVINDLRDYQKKIKGPCRKCGKLEGCYGCRGAAYQITGDYLASDPLCWENIGKYDEIARLPIETGGIVPHTPPMLVVDKLMEIKEKVATTETIISKDSIFMDESGKLDEVTFIEMIAQSVAAQDTFKKMPNRNNTKGFLTGVKNLKVYGTVGVGDTLTVTIYKIADFGEHGVIRGKVVNNGNTIAEGELKFWQEKSA